MARIIIGGYQRDLNFNLPEDICRAIQNATINWLRSGKPLFLRVGGEVEGADMQTVAWIGQQGSVRFEYDAEIFPELNEELAAVYQQHLEKFGGIIIPSRAEADMLDAAPVPG